MTKRFRSLIGALMLSSFLFGASACSSNSSAQTAALPWSDGFDDPKSGWTITSDLSGDVKYADSRLHITVKNENLTIWSTAGKVFRDGVFQIDAQPIGGPQDNGFGVLYRVTDRKNFYHFEISSDGYWRAGITKDGKWTNWADWMQHPAIKTGGESKRLRTVRKGNKSEYYVNDQLIGSREDDSFAQGDVGVLALTVIDQPGTDVVFDNASVTEVEK